VTEWEHLNQPWPTAYARWRFAESILLARDQPPNDRAVPQRLLRDAHTAAAELGAKPLLADIQDLASRARIDLTIDDVDPLSAETEFVQAVPFDLTPRELSVLGLVAEGYSNGRIGNELFISTKTASVHVSNILRKLGASNRIEAAAIATKAGITKSPANAD
jgi:DNA-binding NarL/FixJ family response regulator